MPPILSICIFLLPAILFSLPRLPGCSGAQGKFAYKLLKDLFTNYSSALRPAEDTDQALNVTLQVTLSQIIDMDERNQVLTTYLWIRQVWTDTYLSWEKEAYDGLDSIRIPSGFVWRPDIVLYNNADDQFASSMETNVVIRYDGQITWDSPSITRSSCKVDVSYFPFDGQQCQLTFGSWTYNGNQIDLQNRQDSADLADFVENVEWEVLGMPAERHVVVYGCCSEPYPDVTYTLRLQRRASFYVVNLLLPCLLVSFLAPLGFYLPADSGEKVSLGVTVLLALTVFQLLVAESMPPSENVPLIGKYYIATMTLIATSTALTIFVLNLHHCGPAAKPLPRWARKVILGYLARLFFVYEVGESCRNPWRDPDPHPMVQAPDRRSAGQRMASPQEEGSPQQGLGHSSPSGLPDWSQARMFVNLEVGRGGDGQEPPASQGKSPCFCPHRSVLRNVKFIASFFRDQKAASKRAGEWKRVARVLDRFFMWLFFAMVFLMSALVMGQAVLTAAA